jgi:hypothetical protein
VTSPAKADETRHPEVLRVMRFVFAYLIGLAACFISVSIAHWPHGSRWNLLFAASLGISSTVAGVLGRQAMSAVSIVPAVAVLSLVFLAAELRRSRGSWLRWIGYGVWALLAVALLWWFPPPNI